MVLFVHLIKSILRMLRDNSKVQGYISVWVVDAATMRSHINLVCKHITKYHVIKIAASYELLFKKIKVRVASCKLRRLKSRVASWKIHFKKLKVRVENLKCELKIKSASYKLKVRVANQTCELLILKCDMQNKSASCKFKVRVAN